MIWGLGVATKAGSFMRWSISSILRRAVQGVYTPTVTIFKICAFSSSEIRRSLTSSRWRLILLSPVKKFELAEIYALSYVSVGIRKHKMSARHLRDALREEILQWLLTGMYLDILFGFSHCGCKL